MIMDSKRWEKDFSQDKLSIFTPRKYLGFFQVLYLEEDKNSF